MQQVVSQSLLASRAAKQVMGLVLTAFVLALAWAAWLSYLERSCSAKEWPYLETCERAGQGGFSGEELLKNRIARNPGDSNAWIELAVSQAQPGSVKPNGVNALDVATRLAGEDPRVQRLQAARALEQQQWPLAVDWLLRLVRDASDSAAAVALAAMIPQPQAFAALQAQLESKPDGLSAVIGALPQAKVPLVMAMPLVVSAQARQQLPPELVEPLIRDLKAQGQWLDAHAFWVASLGRQPVNVLFNSSFDQGFLPGGFDWEVMPAPTSRAGALVGQLAVEKRGGVLQLDFTGRPITVPVLRQHLILLNNRYRLTGQFMTDKLKSDAGLAWVLQCVGNGRELARSDALQDTAGQWKPFAIAFDLPSGCGYAVALQLQTNAAYESSAGLRGQAFFDDFKLEVRP